MQSDCSVKQQIEQQEDVKQHKEATRTARHLAGMQRNVSTRATLMTNDSCLFGAGLQVSFKADAE